MGNTNFGRDYGSTAQQQVAGTVALDAPTQAALETVTANGGTPPAEAWPVALDASSLAALETVQVGTVNGVAPQFDDTDKQAVSLYGKSSAAGDTAVLTDATGNIRAAIYSGTTQVSLLNGGNDGQSSGGNGLAFAGYGLGFNGSGWDRQRNNIDVTVLASAARTIATNSADLISYNARFLRVAIDISAIAGSPSLVFTVKAKDALSGVYSTILASAALTGTGHTVLLIGPGLLAVANLVANAPLPRTFRVEVTVGTADSVTYSVGAVLST